MILEKLAVQRRKEVIEYDLFGFRIPNLPLSEIFAIVDIIQKANSFLSAYETTDDIIDFSIHQNKVRIATLQQSVEDFLHIAGRGRAVDIIGGEMCVLNLPAVGGQPLVFTKQHQAEVYPTAAFALVLPLLDDSLASLTYESDAFPCLNIPIKFFRDPFNDAIRDRLHIIRLQKAQQLLVIDREKLMKAAHD